MKYLGSSTVLQKQQSDVSRTEVNAETMGSVDIPSTMY